MKSKLLILLFMFMSSSIVFSQKTKTKTYTIPTPTSKSFVWKKGDGSFVDVKFTYTTSEKISSEILSKFVMEMMVKSSFEIKNKLTFKPLELMIYEDKDKNLKGFTKYSGKNDYGVEKELSSYFDLDKSNGDVKLSFTN